MILKKNIQYYIKTLLILSILFVFMGFSSCYAYSWDDFVYFLEMYKDSYNEPNMCSSINLALQNIDGIKTKFTNGGYNLDNYKSFYCVAYKLDYTYTAIFYAYEYDDIDWSCLQNNTIQFNTANKYEVMVRFNYGSRYNPTSMSIENPNRQLRSSGSVSHLTGLFNTEARNGTYYDTTYVNQYYRPQNPLSLTSSLEHIIINSVDNLALRFNYINTYSKIGSISGIDNIMHYLYASFSGVGSGINLQDTKNLYNGFNTSTDLYIDDSYNVFVKNRYLNYNTSYSLYIGAYTDSTMTEQVGYIDQNVFAIDYNTVLSGDSIVSLSSGEYYSTQDSTIDLISSITEFTPLTSGDILGSVDMPPLYSQSVNDNFLNNIIGKISDVFLYDDEITILVTLPIFGRELYIRSDFYPTAQYLPELATFVGYAWYFLIGLIIIYRIDMVIQFINLGDIRGLIADIYTSRRLL